MPTPETRTVLIDLEEDLRSSDCNTIPRAKALLTGAIGQVDHEDDGGVQSELQTLRQQLDDPEDTPTVEETMRRVQRIRARHYDPPEATAATPPPATRSWLARYVSERPFQKAAALLAILFFGGLFVTFVWNASGTTSSVASGGATGAAPGGGMIAADPESVLGVSVSPGISCSSAVWQSSTTAVLTTGTGKWRVEGIQTDDAGKCAFASGLKQGQPVPSSCFDGNISSGATNLCPKRTKL